MHHYAPTMKPHPLTQSRAFSRSGRLTRFKRRLTRFAYISGFPFARPQEPVARRVPKQTQVAMQTCLQRPVAQARPSHLGALCQKCCSNPNRATEVARDCVFHWFTGCPGVRAASRRALVVRSAPETKVDTPVSTTTSQDVERSASDIIADAQRTTNRTKKRQAESTDAVATFMTRRFGWGPAGGRAGQGREERGGAEGGRGAESVASWAVAYVLSLPRAPHASS
jgi:hypothetical protein